MAICSITCSLGKMKAAVMAARGRMVEINFMLMIVEMKDEVGRGEGEGSEIRNVRSQRMS